MRLLGQLLALAYVSRLLAPPPGTPTLGTVTAVYTGLFMAISLLGAIALPSSILGLSRTLVVEELQLWRPFTALLWSDGIGLDFGLQLWFFGSFSSLVEKRHYSAAPFKYAATIFGGAMLIALQVRCT